MSWGESIGSSSINLCVCYKSYDVEVSGIAGVRAVSWIFFVVACLGGCFGELFICTD